MKIGNKSLNDQVYIIAEMSANHSQSINIAKDTIYAAKEAGADAVKVQTFTPDDMTLRIKKKEFLAKNLWEGEYLYDLYQKSALPLEWHEELFSYAENIGIDIFSTPFSKGNVDFLKRFNPIAYKIASYEITDYELVEYVAKQKKPVIISTGIARIDEIYDVVNICKNAGNKDIVILKCTSSYPTPLEEANLKTIENIKQTFGVEVGFSDHTLGITAPIVAVSLGARVIEKHFILDKNLDSPDREFSLDVNEFAQMVKAVREAERLIGEVSYDYNKKSRTSMRSLYVVKDVKKGETFSEENIKSIRPGYGLHPKYLPEILGKRACKDLKKGDRLRWEDITD